MYYRVLSISSILKLHHLNFRLDVSSIVVAMLLTVFISSSCLAQEQEIEEVIIQADETDRLENDLVSASLLTGEKLADAGIENVEDVAAYVPNLVLTETDTGTNIVIRGIGAGVNQGFDQSVGLYVDGVPLPRSQMARSPFLDLANVQVLRGPQYVLDGNYSIAGSVHLTTEQATDEFTTGFDFNYIPSQNDQKFLLTTGIPLGSKAGIRLAIQDQRSDGYIRNVTRDEDGPARDQTLVRLVVGWEPTDNLSLKFKTEFGRFDTRGRQIELINDDPTPEINATAIVDGDLIERGVRAPGGGARLVQPFWDDTFFAFRPKRILYDIGDLRTSAPAVGQDFLFAGYSFTERLEQNYLDGIEDFDAGLTDIPVSLADIPAGLTDTTQDFRRGANADEFSNNDSLNITLNAKWNIGDSELSLTTSYIDYEVDENIDGDFTAAPLFEVSQFEEYDQSFHRIDYVSPQGGFVEVRAGASYLDSNLFFTDRFDPDVAEPDSLDINDILAFSDIAAVGERALEFNPAFPFSNYFGRFTDNNGSLFVRAFEVFRPSREFSQDNQIAAAFLQTKFNFADNLRATLGVRYTRSKKTAVRDLAPLLFTGELLDFTQFATGSEEEAGAIELLERVNAAFSRSFNIQAHTNRLGTLADGTPLIDELGDTARSALDDTRTEEQFLPSLSVEWDVNSDLTLLASVRLANKLGGFDARANTAPVVPDNQGLFPGTFEFEDENATTFELGTKWFHAFGEFNATWFFTEFENLQVSRSDGRFGFGVDNAGVAHVQGVEVEGLLQLTDNFDINYSLAYIDFEFQEFLRGTCSLNRRPDNFFVTSESIPELTNTFLPIIFDGARAPTPNASGLRHLGNVNPTEGTELSRASEFNETRFGSGAFCDFAGQTNQFVAQRQGTVTFNYRHQIAGTSAQIKSALDVIYNSGYQTTVSQEEAVAQPEYVQLNGRLALAHADQLWELALTGENLTNEGIISFAAEVPIALRIQGANSFYGFVRPPRSIGLNFRYNIF